MDQVRELVSQNRKLEAIKRYCDINHCTLKEGKEAVDAICLGCPVMPEKAAPLPANLDSVEALLRAGRKLEAVKLYRDITGAGLKEAKDHIDAMSDELAVREKSWGKRGKGGYEGPEIGTRKIGAWLVAAIVLAVSVAAYLLLRLIT